VSYSPSLLGSTAVASQPHPDRKSVLVDANTLFLSDLLGMGMQLQRTYRQGYAGPRQFGHHAVRGSARRWIIETQTTTHRQRHPRGAVSPGGAAGAPAPRLPRYLPDARSLFIGQHYSLAPLPDAPMPARRADPRWAFTTQRAGLQRRPRALAAQRFGQPLAAGEEGPGRRRCPSRSSPSPSGSTATCRWKYRDTVRAAVLEWNKAFERIGFKQRHRGPAAGRRRRLRHAGPGLASVRWLDERRARPSPPSASQSTRAAARSSTPTSPSKACSRAQRNTRAAGLPRRGATPARCSAFATPRLPGTAARARRPPRPLPARRHAGMAEQLAYALDVLEWRGGLDPGSPQAEEFVRAYLKDTVMHEVGHALGLRHNFRASRAYTEAQLADAEFTREPTAPPAR
jgi:hypothetical protein